MLIPTTARRLRIRTLRGLILALPIVLALDLAPRGAAGDALSPNAERLFTEGLKLAHTGDCVHARDKFTESYAADPAPGTLINWALCEEKLGRSATALELLRLADQTLPPNHPKRSAMVKHIDALTKRAPLLRLRVARPLPAGAVAKLDGALLEASAFSRGVLGDPGNRIIELQAPGREDRRYEVTLSEGTTLEVTVEPGPPRADPSKPPADAQGAGRGESATSSGLPSALGWGLGAGGLALVGTGVVTGIMAKDKWDTVERDCDVQHGVCFTDEGIRAGSSGATLAAVSTASFIVGGASLAVGAYLLLTKKDAPATARVAASAGPGSAGVRIVGEF